MLQTILIPFDTSAKAGLAVDYATAIARATGGRLSLYAVIPDEGRSAVVAELAIATAAV